MGSTRQQKKKLQSCRLCNASFDRRHKLEDHMVTVHNKVVEEPSRPSIFESDEGVTAPRFMVDRLDPKKPQDREEQNGKTSLSENNNPSELSIRCVQNIHGSHLKNLELRNIESGRNLELIRLANGAGVVEESLRMSGSGSGTSWTYVNPGA